MATPTLQPWSREAWRLARLQYGVVARSQLLGLGMPAAAIRHRLETGRLHELHRGIYAIGRPEVGRLGHFMAAVLACGREAQLSHRSGADLWGIRKQRGGLIDVTVPDHVLRRRPGIKLHRRAASRTKYVSRVPAGDPISILVDLATCLPTEEVEDAVNEADRLSLVPTDRLRRALDEEPPRPGVGRLRRLLDAQTFSAAQTKLERRFVPIARAAGLPGPRVQAHLNSIRRDQAHVRTGLRPLRFTHPQVFFQPDYVRGVLEDTVRHL